MAFAVGTVVSRAHKCKLFRHQIIIQMIYFTDVFENSEENKMEYTTLFNEYTALVEGLLNRKLSEKIPVCKSHVFPRCLHLQFI